MKGVVMTTFRTVFLAATAGMLATGLLLPAAAQQATPQPPATTQNQPGPRGPGMMGGGGPGMMGSGMMMGPGMMSGRFSRGDHRALCNPRAAGFAEWRIARIERAVNLNETQKKAVEDLRAASNKAAEQIAAACPTQFPTDPSARFAAMEKRMEAMLQAIKTVRPAFDAFYATLDDKQKAQLDRAGPRRWGWRRWG
jgi:hypothetical protein